MIDFGDIGFDYDFYENDEKSEVLDYHVEYLRDNIMKYEYINDIKINIPGKNQSLFLITSKAFSMFHFVNYIQKSIGKIEEGIFFVYTLNKQSLQYLNYLNKVSNIKIALSDFVNSKSEKQTFIRDSLLSGKINFITCHSHAKISAIKINDNYYVISGSMNFGNNAKVEQLIVDNSQHLYEMINNTYEEMKLFYLKKQRNGKDS